MSYNLEAINRLQEASETDSFTEDRYRQFARHLGSGFQGKILDIGCNTGRGGGALKAALTQVEIHGLDMLKERLDLIPSGVYASVFCGLLDDVAVPPQTYEAVVMGEVIEHIPYDAFDDVLSRVKNLLQPGGHLLLTTPNPHYVLLKRRSAGSVLGGAHVSVHCPEALSQYLRFRGFESIKLSGSGKVSKRLGEKLMLRLYGSYLLTARKPL